MAVGWFWALLQDCEKATLQPSSWLIPSSMEQLRATLSSSPHYWDIHRNFPTSKEKWEWLICLHLLDLIASVVFLCLRVLLLPPALVDSSRHLATMGSDLPPALGAETWFTSAACLFSRPPPGGGLCAMDCSVLFSFLCVCVYTYFYICIYGNTDTGMDFPALAFPPTHRWIPLSMLLSPQK